MKHDICVHPFERLEIYPDGTCGCCCPIYTDSYNFGQLIDNSFEGIWNSENFQEFRKSILDGSYKYCHLDMCANTDFKRKSDEKTDIIMNESPKFIELCIDKTCNYKCVYCRDEIMKNENIQNKLQSSLFSKIPFIFKDCEILSLNGAGECFVSPHCQSLIYITSKLFPKLKYYIITNGSHCTPEKLKKLNILNKRIDYLTISLHSLNPETYEKITRSGGMFQTVIDNIHSMVDIYRKDKIRCIALNFVISSLNYQELPDLAKFCVDLGIEGRFWEFRKWDESVMCTEHYDEYNVTNPCHPEYSKLKKKLQNSIFDNRLIFLNGILSNIRNSFIFLLMIFAEL